MEKGISEIVGRATLSGGKSVDVYSALRPLLCSTCGANIAEGTLFTRRKVKGIGLRIMPQCQECAPFTLQPTKAERSQLLRALLTEQPADDVARNDARSQVKAEIPTHAEEGDKNLNEEVRRRLGPALKRGRRGRKI